MTKFNSKKVVTVSISLVCGMIIAFIWTFLIHSAHEECIFHGFGFFYIVLCGTVCAHVLINASFNLFKRMKKFKKGDFVQIIADLGEYAALGSKKGSKGMITEVLKGTDGNIYYRFSPKGAGNYNIVAANEIRKIKQY